MTPVALALVLYGRSLGYGYLADDFLYLRRALAPAVPFLHIEADQENSRLLYFPVAVFAVALGLGSRVALDQALRHRSALLLGHRHGLERTGLGRGILGSGPHPRGDDAGRSTAALPLPEVHETSVHWRACGGGNNMKNITLSADEHLIEAARARARAERTTLNEQFRHWLGEYAQRQKKADAAMAVIDELRGKLRTGGRRFTREEMNER